MSLGFSFEVFLDLPLDPGAFAFENDLLLLVGPENVGDGGVAEMIPAGEFRNEDACLKVTNEPLLDLSLTMGTSRRIFL